MTLEPDNPNSQAKSEVVSSSGTEKSPPTQKPADNPEKKGQGTLLDLAACRDVALRQLGIKKTRIEEEIKAKTAEPAKLIELVENFRLASPCSSKWSDNAEVGERIRTCKQCQLKVYDFSHLTDDEAKDFVSNKTDKRPIFFYRRADGKFLLSDCPIGAKARATKISVVAAIASAVVTLIVFTILSSGNQPSVSNLPATPDASGSGTASSPDKPALGAETLTKEAPPARNDKLISRSKDYWSRVTDDYWRYGAKRGEVNLRGPGEGESLDNSVRGD